MKYIIEKEEKERQVSYFIKDKNSKIILCTGKKAFLETIEQLETLEEAMPLIKLNQQLCVKISKDPKHWADKNYIKELVKNHKKKFIESGKFKELFFHFDIGSCDAQTSFLLQLVDDTPFRGLRSKNFFNQKISQVGISNETSKKLNCCYFLFGAN